MSIGNGNESNDILMHARDLVRRSPWLLPILSHLDHSGDVLGMTGTTRLDAPKGTPSKTLAEEMERNDC